MGKKQKDSYKVVLNGLDKELNLEAFVKINMKDPDKSWIHIEKGKKGGYRLFYTDDMADDIKELRNIELVKLNG